MTANERFEKAWDSFLVYLIQAIYAHVHSYVSLADIVLGTLIQAKHTASSFS